MLDLNTVDSPEVPEMSHSPSPPRSPNPTGDMPEYLESLRAGHIDYLTLEEELSRANIPGSLQH